MTDTTTTPDAADEAVSEHALGELEHIDPTSLQVGENIREYANLDKAFLDSIAEHGVLVPITAIRRHDGGGKRRSCPVESCSATTTASATGAVIHQCLIDRFGSCLLLVDLMAGVP